MPLRHICIVLAITLTLVSATESVARRVRTRRADSVTSATTTTLTSLDTLLSPAAAAMLTVSGYDKPLRATRETMFLTNNDSSRTVGRVVITINYTDDFGRQLHSRQQPLDINLPPAQTRQVTMPSWDIQHSFYYRGSTPPRHVRAYRYDISITIDTILCPCPTR